MTNEQICQAIEAIKKSDIVSLFNDLNNKEQENYKLCFNIESLQLFFCEPPNSIYPSAKEIILCVLTKNEILDTNHKSIIIEKFEKEYGPCDKSKINYNGII